MNDKLKTYEEKMKKAINEIVHTESFQQTLFKTLEKSDISEERISAYKALAVELIFNKETKT